MSFKSARSELTERRDVIQETADRIIEALEKGVEPWVRPWSPDKCAGPQAPVNGATGTMYHGINVLLLGMHPLVLGGDPRMSVKVDGPKDGWVTILTTVENKGNRKKDIESVLLRPNWMTYKRSRNREGLAGQ